MDIGHRDGARDIGDTAALQRSSFERATAATASAFPEGRRMGPEALRRFLGRKRYLVMSSTRADGRSHVAMSAFLFFEGVFWCPTMAGTVRRANIAGRPWCALVVTEGEDDDHAVALAEGPAEVVAADRVDERVRLAWRKKFSREPEWATGWIVVRPRRLLSFAGERWR